MPDNKEITSLEAAELLNVPHPFFNQLLDAGTIAFRKVDSKRYVLLHEVVQYKQDQHAVSEKVLNELVQQAQELDMGY